VGVGRPASAAKSWPVFVLRFSRLLYLRCAFRSGSRSTHQLAHLLRNRLQSKKTFFFTCFIIHSFKCFTKKRNRSRVKWTTRVPRGPVSDAEPPQLAPTRMKLNRVLPHRSGTLSNEPVNRTVHDNTNRPSVMFQNEGRIDIKN
jgi:hypothetical protein